MWAARYWTGAFWAAHYWAKRGAEPPPVTGQSPAASRYRYRARVDDVIRVGGLLIGVWMRGRG